MAKRISKKRQAQRIGAALLSIRDTGKPYVGRKDGGIPTKPLVPCADVLESVVTDECNRWLDAHRIFYDRNNCGMGDIGDTGNKFTYGITGGGDVIGLLPKYGTHFEIEYKRGRGGILNTDQQDRKRDVRANGGVYIIVHGLPELIVKFKGYLR